jgi:hypothetical protein
MPFLASRADLEAWLNRAGHAFFVDEPTLRLPVELADGESTTVEILWNGAKGIEVFVPLSVTVEPERERAVDLALAELNVKLLDAGLRRSGPGVVAGHIAFPGQDGTIAAEVIERAMAACREAAAFGGPRLAAVIEGR